MQKNTQTGFTLVELMIVVAVVGILAAIAYPNYQDSMRKSRRADAKAALSELSVFMERWYTANGCYTTVCPTGTIAPTLPFNISPKSLFNPSVASSTITGANYDLSVCVTTTGTPCSTVTVPTAGFTLVAVPRATRPDTQCGNLTLDSTGVKGSSLLTGAAAAVCW